MRRRRGGRKDFWWPPTSFWTGPFMRLFDYSVSRVEEGWRCERDGSRPRCRVQGVDRCARRPPLGSTAMTSARGPSHVICTVYGSIGTPGPHIKARHAVTDPSLTQKNHNLSKHLAEDAPACKGLECVEDLETVIRGWRTRILWTNDGTWVRRVHYCRRLFVVPVWALSQCLVVHHLFNAMCLYLKILLMYPRS